MPPSRDYLIRDIAIHVLATPERFDGLKHDDLRDPLRIEPHHHDGTLQVDLIRGCSGQVFVDDRWLGFEGELGLITYPRVTHGYTLEPKDPHAAVLHFKIPLGPESEFAKHRPLPSIARLAGPDTSLFRVAEGALKHVHSRSLPSASGVLELAKLLADWPHRGGVEAIRGSNADVHPLVEDAVTLIEDHLDDPPSLEDLAAKLDVSGRHLSRLFVASTGSTPHAYAAKRRLALAKSRLLSESVPISEVAFDLGFSGPATFTRWFRRETGSTPSDFRSDPAVF
ncbi:MAG: AraC family transcriptional regulator [Planctomycetota bacterium]